MSLRIVLSGANGVMGNVFAAYAASQGADITAGFDKETFTRHGFPVFSSFGEISGQADVVVDFSHFSVQGSLASFCRERGLPLVSATTGLTAENEALLEDLSASVAVFRAKNFSFGISVLEALAESASSLLSGSFDAEIVEYHHNKKADAPSGTAEILAQAVARGSSEGLTTVYGRHGNPTKRQPGEMTIHSVRAGSIVGTHEIIFGGAGETITLTHSALSKDVFASGAWIAANYIVRKAPGMYSMKDLIKEGMDR